MKKTIGKYTGVRAITKAEAIGLAKEIFNNDVNKLRVEGEKLWAKGKKLRVEGEKLWAKGNKLKVKGEKLRVEGNKLWAKGNKLWAEIAIKHKGYIPDYRAINLIAKDLPDSVYSFVLPRKEVWIYDGKNCPDPGTVEKVAL